MLSRWFGIFAALGVLSLVAFAPSSALAHVGHSHVSIETQQSKAKAGGQTVVEYAPEERAPVADVYGESLMEEGEEIHLSDFDGEMVVLNAWGQWCAPCRSESDDLQAVHEKMQAEDIGMDPREARRVVESARKEPVT